MKLGFGLDINVKLVGSKKIKNIVSRKILS